MDARPFFTRVGLCGIAVGFLLVVPVAPALGDPMDVRATLSVQGQSFLPGEPVSISVTLQNTGGKDVRMVKPELQGETTTRALVRAPDGKILKYTGDSGESMATGHLLKQESSTKHSFWITKYYWIKAISKYTVQVFTATKRSTRNPEELKSNLIEFEVVEPNGDFEWEQSHTPLHLDGSSKNKMSWQVYTHNRDGTLSVYARGFLGTPGRIPGSFLGPFPIADEDTISTELDEDANLHLLYAVDQEHTIYELITSNATAKVTSSERYTLDDSSAPPALIKNEDGSVSLVGGSLILATEAKPPESPKPKPIARKPPPAATATPNSDSSLWLIWLAAALAYAGVTAGAICLSRKKQAA